MARYRQVDLIVVWAWSRRVGAVSRPPGDLYYSFEYDDDWVRSGQQLAPLWMPNGPGVFRFPELRPETFHHLPPLLADALPDRFGNALVDAWLAEQGVAAQAITALDRLAYSADRGMGALEFRPPADDHPSAEPSAIQLADLVTAARATVQGDIASSATAHDALRQLIQVGTSAGGARPKAVIAYNPDTDQVRSGQLDAPDGFEHWLVKLDGVSGGPTREVDALGPGGGYGRIEYAYHLMARAAGVSMTDCRLLPEGPRTHFLTRRFDRGPGGRRHVLTLCAMAHLDFNLARTHSYSQYLATIDALGLGPDAREQAFRRLVFNVVGLNRDDHTKNVSFTADQGGQWELAPAYDLAHAHNPEGRWTHAHQMSVGEKFENITLDDLRAFGDRHLVPGYNPVIDDVTEAVAAWPDFADQAGVAPDHVARIAEDITAHHPR